MFVIGANVLGAGIEKGFSMATSSSRGHNWSHFLFISFLVVMCNLKMIAAIEITQNSAALEEEVQGQLIEMNGEQRLHWEQVANDVEDSVYCTLAAGGNEYIAQCFDLLRKVAYLFKTSWPNYTATVLPCQRKIDTKSMMYLTASKLVNTCAYVFIKTSKDTYVLSRKVCGLPPAIVTTEKPADKQNEPSSSATQGS